MRHNVVDCDATLRLLLIRSTAATIDDRLQQHLESSRTIALLPSINLLRLAKPFVNHFAKSITIVINQQRRQQQQSYSYCGEATTNNDRFNKLLLSAPHANNNDVDDLVLFAVDKVCQVRLRDLRRLLTDERFNDELVNALIALAIQSSSSQCDAFSSMIVKKLCNTVDNGDWIKRYHSFTGKTFQQLLTLETVSSLFSFSLSLSLSCIKNYRILSANLDSLAYDRSLVIVFHLAVEERDLVHRFIEWWWW